MDAPAGLLEDLLKSPVDAIICLDEQQTITLFSVGAERVFGYSAEEMLGQSLARLLPTSAAPSHVDHVRNFQRSTIQSRRMGERSPVSGRRKDGGEFPAEVSISKFVGPNGLVLTAMLRDISERVSLDQRLQEREQRLRLALLAGRMGVFQTDERTGATQLDEHAQHLLSMPAEFPFQQLLDRVHPDDRMMIGMALDAARRADGRFALEFRLAYPEGPDRWLVGQGQVEFDELGRALRRIGVVRDVTERKRLEEDRTLDQQRLRSIYDQSVEFLGLLDLNGNLVDANHAALSFIGMELDQVYGRPFWETPWWEADTPSREQLKDAIERGRRGEFSRFDAVHINRAGERKEIDFSLTPILSGDGRVMWLLPEGRDVTPYVDAERALEAKVAERTGELRAELQRREQAQAALAEAQRLEAIGKLTGGVAHDANNMLTVIGGNLEMLEDALGAEAPGLKYLREAQSAVERMTQLNRRLLTVARRRKLAPRVLDLNQQVAAMSEMLRRVLGETITLTTTLHADIWKVALDPSELDAALLNLAINARDAMPRGGRLHISTKNVEIDEAATRGETDLSPGRYVSISVTDSGEGIPPALLPRVFEPFFTTKAQGKGTGLGLATVHGFTKQSGGHVTIYSEVGRGTTVNVYFPRCDGADVAPMGVQQTAKAGLKGSGETVLVVEDDAQVRAITCARLERLGYRALEAPDGPSALALLQRGEHVDLVFSDIVMSGGMSGFDLMSALDERAPQLPVLLTSGFDLDAVRNGERQFSAKVLQKPYSQYDLAEAVRAALARAS